MSAEPGVHPDPPPDLASRRPLLKESAGPWIRFHDSHHEPAHFSRGLWSRFNDPTATFGVLYVAADFEGAFVERCGRRLDVRSVTHSGLYATGVARLEGTRALRLIDLASSGGTARLSADARLMAGPFDVAQRWARALFQHPIAADGLCYSLRHDSGRIGYALFDRARDAVSVTRLGSVADPAHRDALVRTLDLYQFGLVSE